MQLELVVRFDDDERRAFDRVTPSLYITYSDDADIAADTLRFNAKARSLIRRMAEHDTRFTSEEVFKAWSIMTGHRAECSKQSQSEYWEGLLESTKRHPSGGVATLSPQTIQMTDALRQARRQQAKDAEEALVVLTLAMGRLS